MRRTLGLISLVLANVVVTSSIVYKCIRKGDQKVSFTCPDGHVTYEPSILVGESKSDSCVYKDGDCTGLTYGLLTQKNKCIWKNSCTFRWRNQQPIVWSRDFKCKGRVPSYINMENPLCIPQDNIFSISDGDFDSDKIYHGVVRSHSDYPWVYSGLSGSSSLLLKSRLRRRLVVYVDALDLSNGVLTLETTTHNLLFRGSTLDERLWRITNESVIVTLKVDEGQRAGTGFILRFEYSSANANEMSTESTTAMSTVDLFSNSLFKVFGAIEECVLPKRKQLNLACPPGQVIYKPKVKVGVSTDGRCTYRHGDCVGISHTLLTQRNACYWKPSCAFSWRAGIPITVSRAVRCLSLPPRYISFYGYSCIQKETVTHLCPRDSALINSTDGIIMSHDHYPWHYKSKRRVCSKRLVIPKGATMSLTTLDVDLDPDTKGDNVKVYHIKNNRRSLRQKLNGNKELDESFYGGCVDIVFRVSRKTKSGRGFVIKYKLDQAGPVSREDYDSCARTNVSYRKGNRNRRRHTKKSKVNGKRNGRRRKNRRKSSRRHNARNRTK